MSRRILIIELSVRDVVELLNRNELQPPPNHLDDDSALMEIEERDGEPILVVTVTV